MSGPVFCSLAKLSFVRSHSETNKIVFFTMHIWGKVFKNWVLSHELIKVELPPWKISKSDISSFSPSSDAVTTFINSFYTNQIFVSISHQRSTTVSLETRNSSEAQWLPFCKLCVQVPFIYLLKRDFQGCWALLLKKPSTQCMIILFCVSN